VASREVDPLGAGLYVFSNRRWRTPDAARERDELVRGFIDLSRSFPRFGSGAELPSFLSVLSEITRLWRPSLIQPSLQSTVHRGTLNPPPPNEPSEPDAAVTPERRRQASQWEPTGEPFLGPDPGDWGGQDEDALPDALQALGPGGDSAWATEGWMVPLL
jgi:hypothetical protein